MEARSKKDRDHGYHGSDTDGEIYRRKVGGDKVRVTDKCMECGRNAGSRTIAVETGPASRRELDGHCDIVLKSIADIPDIAVCVN